MSSFWVEAGKIRIYVAPITHSPPSDGQSVIEMPPLTKRRLGLDERPSWVRIDELNVFVWPGPDIRPSGRHGSFAYGFLPRRMTAEILDKIRETARQGRAKVVDRDLPDEP